MTDIKLPAPTGVTRNRGAIERLRTYADTHGHTKVPALYKDEDGFSLGSWVAYIRRRHAAGLVTKELETILGLLPGWQWGPLPPGPTGKKNRNGEMVQRHAEGRTYSEIAKEFGVSRQRAHQIVQRETVRA
jgi:hypothetical protein